MMGVHGNGLTSLIWMRPTPRTTVIEFFYPGGFAHDYEYTARSLGIAHYGFWGDSFVLQVSLIVSQHPESLRRSFTSPNMPLNTYPEGFQGRLPFFFLTRLPFPLSLLACMLTSPQGTPSPSTQPPSAASATTDSRFR